MTLKLALKFPWTSQTGIILFLQPAPPPSSLPQCVARPPTQASSQDIMLSTSRFIIPYTWSITMSWRFSPFGSFWMYLIHYHKPSSGNYSLSLEILQQHFSAHFTPIQVPWICPPQCSQSGLYTSDHIPPGLRVEPKPLGTACRILWYPSSAPLACKILENSLCLIFLCISYNQPETH